MATGPLSAVAGQTDAYGNPVDANGYVQNANTNGLTSDQIAQNQANGVHITSSQYMPGTDGSINTSGFGVGNQYTPPAPTPAPDPPQYTPPPAGSYASWLGGVPTPSGAAPLANSDAATGYYLPNGQINPNAPAGSKPTRAEAAQAMSTATGMTVQQAMASMQNNPESMFSDSASATPAPLAAAQGTGTAQANAGQPAYMVNTPNKFSHDQIVKGLMNSGIYGMTQQAAEAFAARDNASQQYETWMGSVSPEYLANQNQNLWEKNLAAHSSGGLILGPGGTTIAAPSVPGAASRNWGMNPAVNQAIAAATGYPGDFGHGEYQAWAAAHPAQAALYHPGAGVTPTPAPAPSPTPYPPAPSPTPAPGPSPVIIRHPPRYPAVPTPTPGGGRHPIYHPGVVDPGGQYPNYPHPPAPSPYVPRVPGGLSRFNQPLPNNGWDWQNQSISDYLTAAANRRRRG